MKIFILCLLILILMGKVNKNMPSVVITNLYYPIIRKDIPQKLSFSMEFPEIQSEISGKIMVSDQKSVKEQHLYDEKFYNKSTECEYFPSTVQIIPKDIGTTGYFGTHYLVSLNLKKIFYGSSNNELTIFNFQESKMSPGVYLLTNQLNMSNSNKRQLFQTGKQIYLTDGKIIAKIPRNQKDNFVVVKGQLNIAADDKMIKAAGISNIQNRFWILTQKQLKILQLKQNSISQVKKYSFPKDGLYLDAVYYQSTNQFIVLSSSNLHVYQDSKEPIKLFFDGICTTLKNYKDIIHLICQKQRKRYIAEYLFENSTLILNRYYNNLNNIMSIFYLGKDRQLITGVYEAILMNQAVNRQVLLDLGQKQPMKTFFSDPLFQVVTFKSEKNPLKVFIIQISVDKVLISQFKQNTPYINCNFKKQTLGQDIYLLATFNTTLCTSVKQVALQKISTLKNICTQKKLYKIHIVSQEFSSFTGIAITLVIGFFSGIITIICIRCGTLRFRKLKQTLKSIQIKIIQAKNKKVKPNPI